MFLIVSFWFLLLVVVLFFMQLRSFDFILFYFIGWRGCFGVGLVVGLGGWVSGEEEAGLESTNT